MICKPVFLDGDLNKRGARFEVAQIHWSHYWSFLVSGKQANPLYCNQRQICADVPVRIALWLLLSDNAVQQAGYGGLNRNLKNIK